LDLSLRGEALRREGGDRGAASLSLQQLGSYVYSSW
jgi:hypothetical protein